VVVAQHAPGQGVGRTGMAGSEASHLT
jgi:hypothetical protein